MLYGKNGRDDLVVRSARVIDPGEGIDGLLDVRVDAGVITEIGLNVSPNGHRVVEGRGLVLAPAFVDPHVHLRTPGREDEETIATGTAAAAAGGYCTILAMPNTEPVVDSAAVLGSLIEAAREEAEVQVGFLAAITKGQAGAELTEMAELADAGADVSMRARKESDLVFAQIDAPGGLAKISKWKESLAPAGALWTITPRGMAGLKDTDVMAVAKRAGLVDVKVVRFSETHSANKFVIPLKDRRA